MILHRSQLLPQLCNMQLRLLLCPPKHITNKQQEPIRILLQNQVRILPNLLDLWIRRPPTVRHLEPPLLNVHKPSLLHRPPLRVILRHVKLAPDALAAVEEDAAPLRAGAVRGHGAVVALEHGGAFKGLEVAAGLEGAVGLGEEVGPGDYGAGEVADVDEVVGAGGEGPFLGAVLNLAVLFSS